MTIIAASRSLRLMMADTQLTSGDDIFTRVNKIFRSPSGHLVGAAGDNVPASEFLQWAMGELPDAKEFPPASIWQHDKLDCMGLVLTTDRRLLYFEGPRPDVIIGDYAAIGAGLTIFNAAMAAGADFRRAMEIVCEISIACSPPLTELKLIRSRK